MAQFTILKDGSLSVEGARILWTNFSGRPTKFNAAGGKRTFNLVLDYDTADALAKDGWNIREIESKHEGDESTYVTEVTVGFGQFPPKIYLIDGYTKRMQPLDEESIAQLDNIDIENIDVIVRPYNHGVSNSRGTTVKGYVKSLYVTQDNSDFDGKYAGYSVNYSDAMDEDYAIPFR